METKSRGNKIIGISPELFWTILSAIIIGAFFLGEYIGQTKFDKEKIDYYDQNSILDNQVKVLTAKIDSIKNSHVNQPITTSDVFINGRFSHGLNMGVNTSEGRTDWAKLSNNELNIQYPNGQAWGAVFITVGRPSTPHPHQEHQKIIQCIQPCLLN